MKHRQNNDTVSLRTVVHRIWKPIRDDTADAIVGGSKKLWLFCCERNAMVNLCDELHSKVGSPKFIPSSSLDELCAGSVTERNR